MIITLPYPPSVNHLWRQGNGRVFKSPEGKTYSAHVGALVMIAREDRGWDRITPPLRVEIALWDPDRRRRDIDNRAKAVLDAVFAALPWDDSQIDDLHIYRAGIDRAQPRCVVAISTLKGERGIP